MSPTEPLLYAVIGVWNEADIVFATVGNAFDQGAHRVFVIDDESDDETCAEAEAAGAEVVRERNLAGYDEAKRLGRYQDLIDEQTALAGREIWWLCIDADEFPSGPQGTTILDFLRAVDLAVDVVGARVLDHYPEGDLDYIPRSHPLVSQPMSTWHVHPYCPRGHWKHPLVRMRQPADVQIMSGFHRHRSRSGRLTEANQSLLLHHFPFRNRAVLQHKLEQAWADGGRMSRGGSAEATSSRERFEMLDLIYAQRWQEIRSPLPSTPRRGLELHNWRELVPASERRPELGASVSTQLEPFTVDEHGARRPPARQDGQEVLFLAWTRTSNEQLLAENLASSLSANFEVVRVIDQFTGNRGGVVSVPSRARAAARLVGAAMSARRRGRLVIVQGLTAAGLARPFLRRTNSAIVVLAARGDSKRRMFGRIVRRFGLTIAFTGDAADGLFADWLVEPWRLCRMPVPTEVTDTSALSTENDGGLRVAVLNCESGSLGAATAARLRIELPEVEIRDVATHFPRSDRPVPASDELRRVLSWSNIVVAPDPASNVDAILSEAASRGAITIAPAGMTGANDLIVDGGGWVCADYAEIVARLRQLSRDPALISSMRSSSIRVAVRRAAHCNASQVLGALLRGESVGWLRVPGEESASCCASPHRVAAFDASWRS